MDAIARPKILIVSGPTAVGKSELAVQLAERHNGEIINLDSVQVYRELEIGSAKPPKSLRARVAHHLFDCASISEHFDVGNYRVQAVERISELMGRGKLPIFCGGSTMYLTILLHGLMQTGATTTSLSPNKRTDRTTSDLYEELLKRDPTRAEQLHRNDRQRIGRAIDLLDQGLMPSRLAKEHAFLESHFEALIVLKSAPRELLYQRINERSAAMVQLGIVEETRTLVAQFGRVRALESLGYRQVLDWDGQSSAALIESIATGTRQYAKRQVTFWRNEPVKRGWIERGVGQEEGLSALVETWVASNSSGHPQLLRVE